MLLKFCKLCHFKRSLNLESEAGDVMRFVGSSSQQLWENWEFSLVVCSHNFRQSFMQNSTKISKFSTRCKILYTRIKKWWKCLNHKIFLHIFQVFLQMRHISRLLRRPVVSLWSSAKLCLVWLLYSVFVPPDWVWLPPGRVWPALWSQSRPLRGCLQSLHSARPGPAPGE